MGFTHGEEANLFLKYNLIEILANHNGESIIFHADKLTEKFKVFLHKKAK
jgi:hypothetical protein